MVLHFYMWGLKRSWKRRLCVENVSCTDTDKAGQDTVFLKKQLFSSVSPLVFFEPIKVIKREKAHSLGYHGRDTFLFSVSQSKILEAEYGLATCVSMQRWQCRNCLCRTAKRTVLAFPCFSYREAVDLMAITWNHPVMVSLSLAVENIVVSHQISNLCHRNFWFPRSSWRTELWESADIY